MKIFVSHSNKDTLSKEEKKSLYQLLNDVRYKKHIAKKYINEDVLIKSLFRNRDEELEKLKNSLKLEKK